ncbi:MAG: subtilisin family serine protease [Parvicellaceae bacterium]|jgi:subtilisin family serine protease
MKKLILSLLTLAFITSLSAQDNIVSGELMVMFKHKIDAQEVLKELNENHPGTDVQIINAISARTNIWHLSFNDAVTSNADAINLFAVREDVEIVQYNHNNVVNRDTVCTNDPNFADQWAWGGSGGSVHILACDAWGITTGGTTAHGDRIVVAVIDGGFDITHQDINFFQNATEVGGTAGVDDDGNGYIDDIDGWDAGGNDGTIPSAQHGTHVSGTVGAIGDNGIGVTGVNQDVDVMAIATNGGGGSFESTVLAAYGYALEMRALYDQTSGAEGAFVVSTNSSFGIDNADPAAYPLWCAFYDSLGAYGIISAGATANANTDIDAVGDVPTACSSDWLISVTNTTSTDAKGNAAWGLTTIDMGAPGTGILSTNPSDAYGSSSGTSMATPHVAGTIGLMWSAACADMVTDFKNDPGNLALTVRNYLLNDGVDYISALSPTGATPTVTGGRLNLYKAVLSMGQYGSCPALGVTDLDFGTIRVFPNPSDGNVSFKYSGLEQGMYSVDVSNLLGQTMDVRQVALNSEGTLDIDYNDLSAGQYILRVTNQNNKASNTFKLIIE